VPLYRVMRKPGPLLTVSEQDATDLRRQIHLLPKPAVPCKVLENITKDAVVNRLDLQDVQAHCQPRLAFNYTY